MWPVFFSQNCTIFTFSLKGNHFRFSLVYANCQHHYSCVLGPLLSKMSYLNTSTWSWYSGSDNQDGSYYVTTWARSVCSVDALDKGMIHQWQGGVARRFHPSDTSLTAPRNGTTVFTLPTQNMYLKEGKTKVVHAKFNKPPFTFFEISIGFHILITSLLEMFLSLKFPVTQFHGFPLILCLHCKLDILNSSTDYHKCWCPRDHLLTLFIHPGLYQLPLWPLSASLCWWLPNPFTN